MKKKVWVSILVLSLIIVASGLYLLNSSLNKIKRVDLPTNNEEIGISQEIPEENEAAGVLNIAFFGLDARNPDLASRSDSIMVVSIDRKNQKVKVTSLMRDMYVPIPGREDNRINAAYAFGGPVLAIKTINSDFNLDIKNFVTVNFFGLEDLINKIGGVQINIKPEEVSCALVKKPGLQTLNGKQAVAYARIRYVGNNDYERTERQRRIINELFKTIKSQGILNLPGTINTLLPYVETNLSNTEILKIASETIKFNTDNIEEYRLPVNGTFKSQKIRGMAVLVPNINRNKQLLHDFIYGENTEASNVK
ncbi:MAG: LCP family protein [Bacillota bacterium]|nr:LCP family protein [Bacillota bacterium]